MASYDRAPPIIGGRSSDGFVVAPTGGYLEQETYWGDRELWIGWTNYPAPFWNEWSWFRLVGDVSYGAYTLWWYGQWIPHFMVWRALNVRTR